MLKSLPTIAAGVLAAGLSGSALAAEVWDMPVPYGDNNFHTLNIVQFAEDVKAATNGELDIKVHSSGSLYKHPDIKPAVRSGQVPIGEFLLSRLSNENAVFEADSVPFLASNYDAARKLWGASRAETEALLEQEGLIVLYAVPWPPQGLYTNKDVNSINDLKGVKFRAYNAATERVAQLAGAVPTQVEVPDIPQAFATGRVEAMITSPSTGANSKAWDFLTNYYDVQGWMPKNVVVMNQKAFRRLDPAVQDALLKAAADAEARGWKASMAETEEKTKMLADNGIKVSKPSDVLEAELKAIGETMTAEWLEKAGGAGQKILDAYNN